MASEERWIAESVLLAHLESELGIWSGTEIAPEHLLKQLISNARHLADIDPAEV